MHTVVIYDTKFGNTEKVADAIGRGVGTQGEVTVLSTGEAVGATGAFASKPDLLLIGGPTQQRGPSRTLRGFVEALPASLRGVPSAAFDTRYRGSTWVMGSAAAEAAKVVGKAGNELVARPESFFIARKGPMERQTLEPGEVERAEQWGQAIAAGLRQTTR